jgi:phosphate acyltransferase
VLLKSSEAVAKLLVDVLRVELKSSLRTTIGAALALPAFKKLRQMMDPEEIGAAPLLGIDGLVFVGHGRSQAPAIVSAIRVAHQAVQSQLIEDMRRSIQEQLAQAERESIPPAA